MLALTFKDALCPIRKFSRAPLFYPAQMVNLRGFLKCESNNPSTNDLLNKYFIQTELHQQEQQINEMTKPQSVPHCY